MLKQRGNILFLILLAVVLFAALSYAVTSSMRGGGKDAGGENNELAAAQILQWFSTVDAAVMRMNMNGIKYEDISFLYDAKYYGGAALNSYMNNSRCTTDACRVFKTDGGGVASPDFSKYTPSAPTGVSTSNLGPGFMQLLMMPWPGAGTDLNDVAITFMNLKPEVCAAIRNKIGQTTFPNTNGSGVQGNLVANWDNASYTFSVNYGFLYGSDTYTTPNAGSGNGQFCNVYHVVIKR